MQGRGMRALARTSTPPEPGAESAGKCRLSPSVLGHHLRQGARRCSPSAINWKNFLRFSETAISLFVICVSYYDQWESLKNGKGLSCHFGGVGESVCSAIVAASTEKKVRLTLRAPREEIKGCPLASLFWGPPQTLPCEGVLTVPWTRVILRCTILIGLRDFNIQILL